MSEGYSRRSVRLPAGTADQTSAGPDEELAGCLAEEMAARWARGDRVRAEELLNRHPELYATPAAGMRVVYEEICLRQEVDASLVPDDFVKRFPQWRQELAIILDCHRLLESQCRPPQFPSVGDSWKGFEIKCELGRGVEGRVYLATQRHLAGRPVVLKLTACAGEEHLSLARLQHTHIVPLYGVIHDPDRDVQALCMPYFSGLTLASLLETLAKVAVARRSGRDISQAVDRANAAAWFPQTSGPGPRGLEHLTYVKAVCHLGMQLAEALHYAHERGLVHLDLKPSNILLTADGQAMLLDFHLARGPVEAGQPAPLWLGGTPAYMSPEQRAGLEAVRQGRTLARTIDRRSDIYSLGLVIYEALVGRLPSDGVAVASSLHEINGKVSAGLSDIVKRCLEPEPERRYVSAQALAADLARHLDDLPLVGVRNRSVAERWSKWKHRHPYGLTLTALVSLVVGLALAGGELAVRFRSERTREANAALENAQHLLAEHRYAEALEAVNRSEMAAAGMSADSGFGQTVHVVRATAERQLARERLHAFCEELRFLVADPHLVLPAQRTRIMSHCETLWKSRASTLGENSGGSRLDPPLRTDLADLAVLWSALRIQSAPPEQQAAERKEALRILSQAEELVGVDPTIEQERAIAQTSDSIPTGANHAASVGSIQAMHFEEHFALGRAFLQAGDLRRARPEFAAALEQRPEEFWPNFYDGVCAYGLRKFGEALSAFRVAVSLRPGVAECYYHRALAQAALGRRDLALKDYDRALQLKPGLGAAALNRAVIRYRLGDYRQALADLRLALQGGADPLVVEHNRRLVVRAMESRS